MARNDIILLDGIIDERVAESIPSEKRDEVFEYFVFEELLKDHELSREELEDGWIDGRNDGGVDGFFIFVNGVILQDVEDFQWPRENASLEVWLVTCKHHATFEQATTESMLSTLQELFDFSIEEADLKGHYSAELLAARRLLYAAYRRLSIGRPRVSVRIVYASRGDTTQVGESVAARARQIEHAVSSLFSESKATFQFIGATELVAAHRRIRKFALSLPFSDHLSTGSDSYVLLVKLRDYLAFVSDERNELRRYLFDSNVRDYMGTQGVNDDIARSLAHDSGPDFWWLNNGVTILATRASVTGKTIDLESIQIVNGLQTTETIFRHFRAGTEVSAERMVLVKIIVSSDPAARDAIIRATNNQTPVEIAALHATDKIQRDIEDILERHGWYYERRKNYFRNVGKPFARLVTPIYLASASVTLLLKNPATARRLRPKFMRNAASYSTVFSEYVPLTVWPVVVDVYKQVDRFLGAIATRRRERFVNIWRSLLSLLVVSRRLGTFDYSTSALITVFDVGPFTDAELTDAWQLIGSVHSARDVSTSSAFRHSFIADCCMLAETRFALAGAQVVGRRGLSGVKAMPTVSADLVDAVHAALPEQPWPIGVHKRIAQQLGKPPAEVQAAIQRLIASKRCLPQRDGIVYDHDGNVVKTDPARVMPESLD